MTTVEAWDMIKKELMETSERLNQKFKESGNYSKPIDLAEYEVIDEVFKTLEFTEEEMV